MQLLTDALHRIAYATDASAYREMPIAVAYPKNEEDLRSLLVEAQKRHTHLIPRAGGTSIAGQVVGNGIVVDVSRYMNAIVEINPDQKWVRVQPGVVRDELNLALKPYGLFFSPETSTSNRCCIGGMVGNNSCGTHSLVYGSTRHHVIGLRIMLADGTVHGVGQLSTPDEQPSELYQAILQQLRTWQQDPQVMDLLRTNFPDPTLQRRSCGYALDEALNHQSSISNQSVPDLCSLITGSEGTLCLVTEIMLSLDPIPPAHKIAVCQFLDHLDDAWQANLDALQQHPVAVELIDGKILQLALHNHAAAQHMQVLGIDPNHLPAAILVSEFWTNDPKIQNSTSHNSKFIIQNSERTTLVDSQVDHIWALRKAGLGVLTGMEGDAKPVGVIEDTAVSPQRLAAYMADFRLMMDQLHLDCVYYGHISTGELHLRPILNLKDSQDRIKFRQVAQATAELVKKHHGSLSGEHGDGRLRGEFIPLVYGQDVYDLFCQLKRTWDPNSLLNMGKIVNTPPMDTSLRYDSITYPRRGGNTDRERRNSSRPLIKQSGNQLYEHAVSMIERCNGSADCRKSIAMGGIMCPTYKMSRDEILSTRARANILREKLTRDPHGITSDEVQSVLDSCLACKGCKGDCPSNVDMTALRSELLQMQHEISGTPFRSWMVARMAVVERLGSIVPSIYNWFATNAFTSSIIKRIVRFAPQRHIPTIARHSMRKQIAALNSTLSTLHSTHSTPTVYLFADEFTSLHEPELGLHFAQLLMALGYNVIVPRHVESGRAAMSKGCLKLATKYVKRNIDLLTPIITSDTPLVGIEPSCILSFRDEYPRLVDDPRAATLAQNCFLYDEWLMREVKRGRISSDNFNQIEQSIYLHGHCHQKAMVGVAATADCLRLTGATVHVIPSSCCGMAGSFGYEIEHYDTSMAIGESVLFPAVRQAKGIVCAPGTSCRQQILDGTGIQALHPIEVLYQLVKK